MWVTLIMPPTIVIYLSNQNYTLKSSEKMLPKLTIENVCSEIFEGISSESGNCRDLQKERIVDLIIRKNPCVKELVDAKHTLKVVFINNNQTGKLFTIGIKVSPAIRSTLINAQGGRLFLGNNCYPFIDRYHFKVCYHCQCIGHLSQECPKKEELPTCLYCSEGHKSKVCPNKKDLQKRNCAKCTHSKITKLVEDSHPHNATSLQCPIIQREMNRLQNNTELDSKNVM